MPKAIALRTTLNKHKAAYFWRSNALSSRRRSCAQSRGYLATGLNSRSPEPRSPPSPATTPAPPAPIQRSARLTNCGVTPASERAGYGTRWCRRQFACRLVTTYAEFEGESVLLEELYKRG